MAVSACDAARASEISHVIAPVPLTRAGVSRRAALFGLGALAAAGPVSGAGPHPDAALFAAMDGYRKALDSLNALVDAPDEDQDPLWREFKAHADAIRRHRAATTEGMGLQLRFIFADIMGCDDSFRAAFHGDPLTPALMDEMTDYRMALLWDMAVHAGPAPVVRS